MRELRWEVGVVLPQELRSVLSPREVQYFNEYNDLLQDYSNNFDLTAFLEPPKQLFLEVVALEDGGDVFTDEGVVTILRGNRYHLRTTEAEALARDGIVEIVEDQEKN